MSNLYWLTDEQVSRLEPYFPKSRGKKRVDDRRVLSGPDSDFMSGQTIVVDGGSVMH